MKTFACWCALLALAVGLAQAKDAAPLSAPPGSHFHLGAYVSYWELSQLDGLDFGGAGGGGIVGHFLLCNPFELDLRLSGFGASDSRDITTVDGQRFENDVTIVAMPLEANVLVRLPLGDNLSLYGGPGFGYYLFDGQSNNHLNGKETVYDIEVDDEFGCYALAGLRFRFSTRLAAFVEGKYTWIETSIEKATDVRRDIGIDWVEQELDFSGLAVNAGLLFTF